MADNTRAVNTAITIDDGSRRVPINNIRGEEIGHFVFRPTDLGILDRFNEMVTDFDKVLEPLTALTEGATEDAILDAKREAKNRLFPVVDKLFNADNSAEAFFGKIDPFSPVEGLFYCEHVLAAVGTYISDQFDIELKKFNDRTSKYTSQKPHPHQKK